MLNKALRIGGLGFALMGQKSSAIVPNLIKRRLL